MVGAIFPRGASLEFGAILGMRSIVLGKFATWRRIVLSNNYTRQLPMGAGHCPWGGYTDQIVCNIHGEVLMLQTVTNQLTN